MSMDPERRGRVFTACVTVWALLATVFALSEGRVNDLCRRDFVRPASVGSCLCGEKQFCLCTPSLAADVIIELEDAAGHVESVVFIERRDGRGLAMVGGFVKVGEAAEAAAEREALEETGLRLTRLRQWCTFSSPSRDPRRHTAALVHVGRARGTPRAADDAKAIKIVLVSLTSPE